MSGANFSEKFNFPSVSNQPCPEKSPEHAASHRIRIRREGGGGGWENARKNWSLIHKFLLFSGFPFKNRQQCRCSVLPSSSSSSSFGIRFTCCGQGTPNGVPRLGSGGERGRFSHKAFPSAPICWENRFHLCCFFFSTAHFTFILVALVRECAETERLNRWMCFNIL